MKNSLKKLIICVFVGLTGIISAKTAVLVKNFAPDLIRTTKIKKSDSNTKVNVNDRAELPPYEKGTMHTAFVFNLHRASGFWSNDHSEATIEVGLPDDSGEIIWVPLFKMEQKVDHKPFNSNMSAKLTILTDGRSTDFQEVKPGQNLLFDNIKIGGHSYAVELGKADVKDGDDDYFYSVHRQSYTKNELQKMANEEKAKAAERKKEMASSETQTE